MLAVKPRRFPTRTLTVNPDLVNPPPQEMERIAREAQQLRQLWDAPGSPKAWDGPFVRPVPDAANSSFGTRSVYNGEARSPHGGTDFLSPAGRPIKAPNAGRVVLAAPLYFTGGTVVIDHGLGVFSLFAHLSVIGVHDGQVVKTGEVIGEVGATGRVTGPHLHWAVRVGGARVDPLSLVAALVAAKPRAAASAGGVDDGDGEAVVALGADGLDRGRRYAVLGPERRHEPVHPLRRFVARRLDHLAVADDVVDDDDRAAAGELQRPAEIVGGAGLVGVDEDEIERRPRRRARAARRWRGRPESRPSLTTRRGRCSRAATSACFGSNSSVMRRPSAGSARASQMVL